MNTFLSFWSTNRLTPSMKDLSNRLNHLKLVHDLITWPYLRVRSFGMIRIRISDPRSLGSWQVKWADESTLDKDLSVHLIYHDTNDLGSLILIRIIPKERTLMRPPHFVYEIKTYGYDGASYTTKGQWKGTFFHQDNVNELKGVGWHHGKKSPANAAYPLVPPSLETLGRFRKDDESGNVNFKKRKL